MKLNLITLATVKIELGLAVGTYDAQITAMIPRVSADVRRILNTNYDDYVSAQFSSAADTISINTDDYYFRTGENIISESSGFPMGQVVTHANIPDDTYVISYDPATDLHTLSATPTDEGDYIYPTVNIAMWSAISKMIMYRITGLNTDVEDLKGVQSERIGTLSVTYSEAEINKQYNYPQALIDDLGIPFSRIG